MVTPVAQRCPECGEVYTGSDSSGEVCLSCFFKGIFKQAGIPIVEHIPRPIKTAIDKVSKKVYVIFDESNDDVAVLQEFDYADEPRKRQLVIWRSKENYIL